MELKEFAEKLVEHINYVYCDRCYVDVNDNDNKIVLIYIEGNFISGTVLEYIVNECNNNNFLFCISTDILDKMYIRLIVNDMK